MEEYLVIYLDNDATLEEMKTLVKEWERYRSYPYPMKFTQRLLEKKDIDSRKLCFHF